MEELDEVVEVQAVELKSRYEGLEVTDNSTFAAMQAIGKSAKDAAKAIEQHMKPQIDDAHAKHKKLTQLRTDKMAPYKAIADGAKKKCIAYQQEQEKLAELERKRAQEKADQEKLARAKVLEEIGDQEAAQAILEAQAPVADPVTPVVKVEGAQKRWHAEITSLEELCKAIGDGRYRPFFLDRDRAMSDLARIMGLNDDAVRLKEKFDVPGAKAVCVVK